MSRAIDLLYIAKQSQIEIVLDKEQLQLKIPKHAQFDKNILQEIKENKALLIDFLKDHNTSDNGLIKIKRANKVF